MPVHVCALDCTDMQRNWPRYVIIRSAWIYYVTKFFHIMVSRNEPSSQEAVLEWLEKTTLVYEKRTERWRELQIQPLEEFEGELLLMKRDIHDLIEPLLRLLQLFVKIEVSEGDTSTCISTLIQKLFRLNPRNGKGNTPPGRWWLLERRLSVLQRSQATF